MEILNQIDWRRMAKPRADEYDTLEIERLIYSSSGKKGKASVLNEMEAGSAMFCNGQVSIIPAPEKSIMRPKHISAATDHPNLEIAERYLAMWPAVYNQFQRLVDTVYPYSDPDQAKQGKWSMGSSSYSTEKEPGCIHVTVDNALGLAQALVKELAHLKLRALGITQTDAVQLIVNDSTELYSSPLRKDRKLPMPGVFHDQYSFIHVTELDLHMLEKTEDALERQHILMLLARNVPRMEAGFEVISRHIKTDEAGSAFVAAFMEWSEQVLNEGQAQLDTAGYGN